MRPLKHVRALAIDIGCILALVVRVSSRIGLRQEGVSSNAVVVIEIQVVKGGEAMSTFLRVTLHDFLKFDCLVCGLLIRSDFLRRILDFLQIRVINVGV